MRLILLCVLLMIAGVTHCIEAEEGNPNFNNLDLTLFKCNPVNLTIKMHEGAGFFAELHKIMLALIHYEERGFARVYVDWTDEFFPYKDGAHENGWDLFFEPIPMDPITKNTNVDS